MDVRIALLSLIVLGAACACLATELEVNEIVLSDVSEQEKGSKTLIGDTKNDQICTLCEEYATLAVDYLTENKTETEVLEILHKACSRVPTFEQQCLTLVDYYAPLFFLEISSVQPDRFCRKFNLCRKVAVMSSHIKEDSCGICHQAVAEALEKLKDPDMQLEIIQVLLKACNSMEDKAARNKCKRVVFKYGPLVLANAEQYLETADICTMLHACGNPGSAVLKADS